MEKGYLVLENGAVFSGQFIGNQQPTRGEVVFNTSMTGYQEILTDPSYRGQILVFCYPLIGNYGINDLDAESAQIQVAGVIIGEVCEEPSHFQAFQTVNQRLKEGGISGLTGVYTRDLVKVLRQHGTLTGMISQDMAPVTGVDLQPHWVKQVSVTKPMTYGHQGPHLVLMDYGYKKSILKALLAEGCRVTVVPYDTCYETVKGLSPDGVLFSNGPGDPLAMSAQLSDIKKISEKYPAFGICFGHQLLALAHGARTEKLTFGHRGANHPVKELASGKVFMTSQNHGYVVLEDSLAETKLEVTYRNVNDKTVEGLQHKHLAIQTVQFHPEANPGPYDTLHLFTQFLNKYQKVEVVHDAFK